MIERRKITSAYGEHFQGESLDVSGAKLLGCTFTNCNIHADEEPLLDGCIFASRTVLSGKWPDIFKDAVTDAVIIADENPVLPKQDGV